MADKYTYISKLSKQEIKDVVKTKIEEFTASQKEFLYRETEDDTLWIGIEEGDHAGYWFIAKLTDTENGCFIDGKVVYDPDREGSKNKFSDIVEYTIIGIFAFFYYLICGIPMLIIWLINKSKGKKKVNYLDLFMTEYLDCKEISKKQAKEIRKNLLVIKDNQN